MRSSAGDSPGELDDRLASDERYRLLVERVKVIAWEADPGTFTFTFVSGQAKAITGYSPEEWLSPGFWSAHLHPEDRERAVQFCLSATAAGRAHEFEYRLMKADGTFVWLRDVVSVEVRDGKPTRLFGVMIDVTDRLNADQALRESEMRYRSVVDSLAEGVVIMDDHGVITACNGAAERIFQARAADIIGVPLSSPSWVCLREDGAKFPHDEFPAVITNRTGVPQSNVIMGVTQRSGEVAWISINTQPIVGPDNRLPCAVVASFHDITERRRSEERQRLLMQELDHRVKNNLASVLSIAEQTVAASKSLSEFRESFSSRIGAMARAHEALAASHWEAVDVEATSRLVLGAFADPPSQRVLLRGPKVRVPSPVTIPLALTLHELLTNAVKHGSLSNGSGTVALGWERDGDMLRISWRESGGPSVKANPKPGVGTQLIDGLIRYQLHGSLRLRHEAAGLQCEMCIPLRPNAAKNEPDPVKRPGPE